MRIVVLCKKSYKIGYRLFCFLLSAAVLSAAILTGIWGWTPCVAYAMEEDEDERIVRVGYYKGDARFQDGFSDGEKKSGYAYEYYQSLAMLTGWSYEYVYGSREEIMAQLIDGRVDIMAGVYQTDKRRQDMLFSDSDMGLSGEPRYFAVNKNRPDLLAELCAAQEKLMENAPDFELSLWQKYYNYDSWSQSLTERETQWLSEVGVLRVGYVKNNLPISGQSEDGEPVGVAAVLFQELSAFLKTPIEPVCYDTVTKMEEGLRAGEIDASFPFYSDMWLAETKGFLQTDSFISERVAVAYQGKYRSDIMDVVALSETALGQVYYIAENYPNAETVMYDLRVQAFEGIKNGEANCIIGCSSILQRFMVEHTEYEDFNLGYLDSSEEFGMAVNRNNSTLAWILNKAIHHIDDSMLTDAMIQYSQVEPDYSFRDLVENYAVTIIGILIIFFAILLFVFVSYRKKTREFNEKQTKTKAALEVALASANSANEAKSTFLSNMSHDIRTPMNAITGFVTLLERDAEKPEKVLEYTKKIRSSSQHLLGLINDVLDMSKIEAGKVTLNESEANIAEIVEETDAIIRPQAKAKNQEFRVYVKNIVHEDVIADQTRIKQILLNLLSNAVKYTQEDGHIQMTVEELPQRTALYARYRISVEDDGYGMDSEYMKTIFDAFSREESAVTQKTQGTGLGMSITKNLVDMMGGIISVKSEKGKGSTFVAELELLLSDSESGRDFCLQNGITRMLVVDDEEDICQYIRNVMDETGITVDYVLDGPSAISAVKEANNRALPYHVILLDWKMPGMDGVETARHIRQEIPENVPLIVLTSYDWAEIEDEARDVGINAILPKPFFITTFIHKLRETLSQHRQTAPAIDGHESVMAGMHILAAEDNDLNAEILTGLLEMIGADCKVYPDGKQMVDAFAASEPGHYQLILSDVQMPVMDGYEAARAIRAMDHPQAGTIPIIAMTANAFSEDIHDALEAGMNAHVSKPLDMEALEAAVRQIMGKQ